MPALAEDWAVPLDPDCDAFEHERDCVVIKYFDTSPIDIQRTKNQRILFSLVLPYLWEGVLGV